MEKFKTAFYLRISREDGDDKESNSITNQRILLKQYIASHENEFEFINEYVDENYTGLNFNRPAFQRMLEDIKNGLINCVICKDLSRFGRDYIEAGHYLEKEFPKYKIRFIAINDNIDSYKQSYDLLLPVKNILNQQYAIDIGSKVRTAIESKQSEGLFIGAFPSYGYFKDPKNHNKLIIDEYAAQIVRRIFKMYLDGYGKIKIAKILNKEGVLCPSEYKNQLGMRYYNGQKIGSTTYWTYSTVHRILTNEMYIGNMVQGKTKRIMKSNPEILPKDKWKIVENTHPPIIDRETWNKVQTLLNKRSRELNVDNNVSIFAGFLKCGDCGRSLAKNIRGNVIYYVCGSYKRYGGTICSPHTIRHDMLEKRVLNLIKIAAIIYESKMNEYRIKQELIDQQTNSIKNEIEKTKAALNKIYNLKKGIYEDYKMGILTKDEYFSFKQDYEKEEQFYNNKIKTLEEAMKNNEPDKEAKKYIKYKNITELTREIMVDCIENIQVFENNETKEKEIAITLTCDNEIGELIKKYSAEI